MAYIDEDRPALASPRRHSWLIALPLAVVILLGLLWTGFWFYAAGATQAAERAAGAPMIEVEFDFTNSAGAPGQTIVTLVGILTDGVEFEATLVLSSVDPNLTFLRMVGDEHLPGDF